MKWLDANTLESYIHCCGADFEQGELAEGWQVFLMSDIHMTADIAAVRIRYNEDIIDIAQLRIMLKNDRLYEVSISMRGCKYAYYSNSKTNLHDTIIANIVSWMPYDLQHYAQEVQA